MLLTRDRPIWIAVEARAPRFNDPARKRRAVEERGRVTGSGIIEKAHRWKRERGNTRWLDYYNTRKTRYVRSFNYTTNALSTLVPVRHLVLLTLHTPDRYEFPVSLSALVYLHRRLSRRRAIIFRIASDVRKRASIPKRLSVFIAPLISRYQRALHFPSRLPA